jgi:hypothetical protein
MGASTVSSEIVAARPLGAVLCEIAEFPKNTGTFVHHSEHLADDPARA